MALKLMGVIAGLGLVAVGLVACEKYDYDPNQPRNWVKFYSLPRDQFPAMIDTLSIKTTDEGAEFDISSKFLVNGGGQFINTLILNCETGAITSIKRTWLDMKGKVNQQETNADPGDVSESTAQPYAQLCKQVGHKPQFLSLLTP